MFKKSDPTPQLDMFNEPTMQLGSRASKKYTDPLAWHNQFYKLITSKVDETIFQPLFKPGNMGAPNASIRVLVGMSILKEGFGCSDEDLFEKCEFDLLTRRALGLVQLDAAAPSIDTYYLFRRRLCEYEAKNEENLMSKCFEQVTGEQVRMLKISGKAVRMDSKLIGSNIAQYSRYELIVSTLIKFLRQEGNLNLLSSEEQKMAASYLKEDPSKTVYRSDKDAIFNLLYVIGNFIYGILSHVSADAPAIDLLQRVFDDQYVVVEKKVELRDKKDISSKSLQSPDDPDATFRDKNGQKVWGYSTNITETVEENKPSIITSVQTEPVTKADCHYLQEAVENSERVTGDKVEALYADGAYQSPDNRKFAKEHDDMRLNICKMQGGFRWDLIPHDEDGLTVVDRKTGQIYEAAKAVTKQGKHTRWRIPWDNKVGWRYFQDTDLKAYQFRKELESLPIEQQHKRNNIEAAMFQYSFHTRNGKTRYRGLSKHRLHAFNRCLWMNLRRIVKYKNTTNQRPLSGLLGSIRAVWSYFQIILDGFYEELIQLILSFRDFQNSRRLQLMSKYATY